MTTPLIPDFIIELYENELRNVIQNVLDVIAKKTNVELDELRAVVSKHIQLSLEIVKPNEEVIKITRVKPRKVPDAEQRCIGNVKRNGVICQCSFSKYEKLMFCKRHSQKLTYGTVDEPVIPQKKHTKRPQKIY